LLRQEDNKLSWHPSDGTMVIPQVIIVFEVSFFEAILFSSLKIIVLLSTKLSPLKSKLIVSVAISSSGGRLAQVKLEEVRFFRA
jgi:hypothetical protein